VKAALKANLLPIVCVGETIGEREAGLAEDIVRKQIEGSLAGLGDGIARVLVAYEPVWAIGTGRTATPEIAQEMHAVIRKLLAEVGGAAASEAVRILYGGSMKPDNAAALLAQGDIDGGLIGGASLDARSFAEIVRIAFEA
jgi:triosephosphate isomerase